jgi:hypothetical protein
VHTSLPCPAPAHFELNNTVFVEEFRIRGNEAGPDQRANIITIANLLQVGALLRVCACVVRWWCVCVCFGGVGGQVGVTHHTANARVGGRCVAAAMAADAGAVSAGVVRTAPAPITWAPRAGAAPTTLTSAHRVARAASPPRAQEVGGNHGVAMWGRSSSGFASMPGMDHLIFVATRMQIRMEAYPMW